MFLCLKEVLNNAYKHSQANKLKLSFTQKDKNLMIEISDDGKGFNIKNTSGNGIRNMERRMKESCGQFEISSSERGTSVFLKMGI